MIVIGGADTALDDYRRAKKAYLGAFIISANQHAWKLGIQAHMAVCVDSYHTKIKKDMREVLQPFGVPIVSQLWWADYHMTDWRNRLGYSVGSGLMALMAGILLGANTVALCGFTWQREGNPNTKEKYVYNTVGVETVRVGSGSLLKLWPGFDTPARRSHILDYLCTP